MVGGGRERLTYHITAGAVKYCGCCKWGLESERREGGRYGEKEGEKRRIRRGSGNESVFEERPDSQNLNFLTREDLTPNVFFFCSV